MEQSPSQPAPRCDAPFSRSTRLCPVCRLAPDVAGLRRCSRVVAESPAMQALLVRAAPIAGADAPVIIYGETGSGKEVVARTIHANSPRRARPFVAINVAALPPELLESELFGHVKGAFTGAVTAKAGLFEAADGGTLFLDEIAEMPAPLQAKMLRALQDGELRRVGDIRSFSVDVRILCATHRNLENAVQHGAVLARGAAIDLAHLPDEVAHARRAPAARPSGLRTLAEAERDHVLEVLEACGGNQIRAAEVLGIGRTTLWRKLRQLGKV